MLYKIRIDDGRTAGRSVSGYELVYWATTSDQQPESATRLRLGINDAVGGGQYDGNNARLTRIANDSGQIMTYRHSTGMHRATVGRRPIATAAGGRSPTFSNDSYTVYTQIWLTWPRQEAE